MHYTELAESVKHFKEKEGGREEMSEIVERYGDERALMANIISSKSHEQHEMDVRPGT